MSVALGVVGPNLAPFGVRTQDSAKMARRRARRFIDVYREVVS